MEIFAFVILLAAMGSAYVWMTRERDRYRNALAAGVFKAWVIERMAVVLRDPEAPDAARSGAEFLLACVSNQKLRDRIARVPHHDGPGSLLERDLGHYDEVIKDALNHTAVVMAFDRLEFGKALRQLLDGQVIDTKEFVSSRFDTIKPGSIQRDEPEWAREMVIGVTHLPQPRAFARNLEENILEPCPV